MAENPGQKNKDNNQNLRRQFILILIVTVIVGFIISMINEGLILDFSGEEARVVANYLLDTTLPDPITNIHIIYKVILGPDFGAYIRFDTAPKHIKAWLKSGVVCFEPNLDTMDTNGEKKVTQSILEVEDGTSRDWWQPDSAIQYTSEYCEMGPNYSILIDQTNDRRWIVYIHGWDN